MNQAVLVPAYGRTYKNKQQVEADFRNGKDFILQNLADRWTGKPCNQSDLQKYSTYSHVEIRYGKNNTKLVILEVN